MLHFNVLTTQIDHFSSHRYDRTDVLYPYIQLRSFGLTTASSARGNTILESAVALTRDLRWDIQSLGNRLAKAASAEEASRLESTRAQSHSSHEVEIRLIVQDIRKLLTRIEDAVPLINLAITTSGASLSMTLPATVSPSRLLQASTFLTAGDTRYSVNPSVPVQVGPTFTLSLYMLFAGHSYRIHDNTGSLRDTTWKEVIHKARVKLMRVPLRSNHQQTYEEDSERDGKASPPILNSVETGNLSSSILLSDGKQYEYAYHVEIIEDLDDDRVHSFDVDEPQPRPYGDIALAGIREVLPIHQISKIFYADTGKILNIGAEGEPNSPILLLKRDIDALPPRRMMQENEKNAYWCGDAEEDLEPTDVNEAAQDDVDQQIRRESFVPVPKMEGKDQRTSESKAWCIPADLDPEWLAFEVYIEEEDSGSDDDNEVNDDSAYVSHRPSSSDEVLNEDSLTEGIANLDLNQEKLPMPSVSPIHQISSPPTLSGFVSPDTSPFGPIRSSLSLLEMLIRLTALQQFQQASHLSIPDELLTFFLEESSTTGAGGDSEERRRTRREARQKVGFDPYDESPVKRRGEFYQNQGQGQPRGSPDGYSYSREGTPFESYDQHDHYPSPSLRRQREQSVNSQATPESWLSQRRDVSGSSRGTLDIPPSSPASPYRPQKKTSRPLDRVKQERRGVRAGSPLGRGVSVDTDSTLGTSPGSPTLVSRGEKA